MSFTVVRKAGVVLPITLALFAGTYQQASADTAMQFAPVNPEFTAYQQLQSLGLAPSVSADWHPLGYIPSPVLRPNVTSAARNMAMMAAYPARYDLRALGKLPAVRNQGSCGDCWAHGALSSLEGALLQAETHNFSEAHLNDTNGFSFASCHGGNDDMSTAYLARWSGAGNDADYPTPLGHNTRKIPVQKHTQNVDMLQQRTGSLDNNAIKAALMATGPVTVSYAATDTMYNKTTHAFYDPVKRTVDHEVAIVGWDDNYAASNFKRVPAGKGAFIVRNSWGSDWGDGGYFYMSYYNATVDVGSVFTNAEPTTNYDRIYDYTPLGQTSSIGYGSTTGWFSNIFTADVTNTTIRAVSFYSSVPNSSYEVYVYNGVTAGKPTSGTAVAAATTKGTIAQAGYHTIHLTNAANVTAGGKFSVVVKLTTPGDKYPIPLESREAGYSANATSAAGQSFTSSNGTSWSDIGKSLRSGNVSLKAFAGGTGTTPNPFAFVDQVNVAKSSVVVSNSVTISGITSAADISITGGEYQINGGEFTSNAGQVNNGDTVTVRHTSASSAASAVHSIVTIGGVADTFSTLTAP